MLSRTRGERWPRRQGLRRRPGLLRGPGWRHRALALAATAIAACSTAALSPASPARADAVRNTEAWVLDALSVQSAWTVTQGKGVTVAVIDSGVDPDVSDLLGNVRTGPNFSGVHTPPTDPNWGVHGTWMASLIAGHGHGPDDDSGIIGMAPESKVLSIRVITDTKDPNDAAYERESAAKGQRELAEAIKYAVNHHAGVISMSLGYSQQSRPVRAALQDAYEHNVVVVASAGNSEELASGNKNGNAPYAFPANYPGVLGVAAVNSAGQVANFSSENLSVQVAAPGYKVPAQGRDGQYWYVSGTSPACALTAGVAALIKAAYPHLTDPQVLSAITSTTTPSTRPTGGYDDQVGFGEVNAAGALTAARKLATSTPAPAGMALSRHFGGGLADIPAAPVPPRGPAGLALYCLLGAACLAAVAIATSKLLTQRDAAASVPGGPADPGNPGSPSGPVPSRAAEARHHAAGDDAAGQPVAGRPVADDEAGPARHAAPRGHSHYWPGPS
ncbi:MAG TPA: S8 family serine peptidase [Streptosporangiaceae bacterium]|nr:S8 family serine peptidase [Streptosporangiaceae bacterium]